MKKVARLALGTHFGTQSVARSRAINADFACEAYKQPVIARPPTYEMQAIHKLTSAYCPKSGRIWELKKFETLTRISQNAPNPSMETLNTGGPFAQTKPPRAHVRIAPSLLPSVLQPEAARRGAPPPREKTSLRAPSKDPPILPFPA